MPVRLLHANEDAALATIQLDPPQRCVMQRLVSMLKQQSLLRVHHGRLSRRHAECTSVEALRANQEATVRRAPHLCLAKQGQLHLVQISQ
jgi:hypothetical protein